LYGGKQDDVREELLTSDWWIFWRLNAEKRGCEGDEVRERERELRSYIIVYYAEMSPIYRSLSYIIYLKLIGFPTESEK
jgi:hypothetical protein